MNRRVYSLSEITAVIRTSIRIEKYGAEFFLDHFSLVGECILECGGLNAKEVCYKSEISVFRTTAASTLRERSIVNSRLPR